MTSQTMYRQMAAPRIFPATVFQHSVAFDPDQAPTWYGHDPRYAALARIRQAVPKRQVEFWAGRHCAREALRKCMPSHADWPLEVGTSGEPLWPSDIVGSITHSAGVASAAVAKRSQVRGIGVDHEPIMATSAAVALVKDIGSTGEVDHVASRTGWPLEAVTTLIFSAKESLFKCLFPEVRRYFDFLEVAIDEVDAAQRTFRMRLLSTFTAELAAGVALVGEFDRQGASLSTGLLLPLR